MGESDLDLLHQKFLGLTFFERRLRECKKKGISHIHVLLPKNLDPSELPHTDIKHSAQYSIEESPSEDAVRIPLYGILDLQNFPNLRFPIQCKDDFDKAEAFVIRDLVETSKTGWVGKNLNKPISIFLSRRLAKTWVTPNAWSFLNLILGVASGYFVAQNSYLSILAGGFLFQLCSIFDGVDGEIAKFRLEYSSFGAWLDTAVDNFTLLFFLSGCYLHVLRFSGLDASHVHLAAALLMLLILLLILSMLALSLRRYGSASLTSFGAFLAEIPSGDWLIRFADFAKPLLKKDLFSMAFFLACLSGHVIAIFIMVALGTMLGFPLVSYALLRYAK